jgi:hypothetical protein
LILENRKRISASWGRYPTSVGRTLRDFASISTQLAALGSRHEFTACVHERSKLGRRTRNDDIIGRHGFTVLAPSL